MVEELLCVAVQCLVEHGGKILEGIGQVITSGPVLPSIDFNPSKKKTPIGV